MNTLRKAASLGLIATLLTFVPSVTSVAHANPTYFAPTVQTATATTSPAFMTPGTATSTLTYDSYSNPTSNHFRADRVSLGVQFAGSSTAAVLAINIEYSQDGIDWYKDYITDPIGTSTSSPIFSVGTPSKIAWTFASSTTGGAAATNANGATSTALFSIPTPTRYVRVITSVTGANASIWQQFIPIKQQL